MTCLQGKRALRSRWRSVAVALAIAQTGGIGCADEPKVPLTQLQTDPVADPAGCTWQPPVVQGALSSAVLNEISGIAASRRHPGRLWVHNDSGAKPELHLLQPTGQQVLTLYLVGAPHTDWEDMALEKCPPQLGPSPGLQGGDCLWVADIGDNAESRTKIEILVVPEPADLPPANRSPAGLAPHKVEVAKDGWRAIEVTYPDGAHNAEAMALLPGGWALILTKRDDGKSALYRAAALKAMSSKDGKIKAEYLGLLDLSAAGVATGERLRTTAADFDPASSRLAVRTYGSIQLFDNAQLLTQASPPEVAAQVANWHGFLLPSPAEPQGEALAFQGAKRWVSVTEGPAAKIFAGECTGP